MLCLLNSASGKEFSLIILMGKFVKGIINLNQYPPLFPSINRPIDRTNDRLIDGPCLFYSCTGNELALIKNEGNGYLIAMFDSRRGAAPDRPQLFPLTFRLDSTLQ